MFVCLWAGRKLSQIQSLAKYSNGFIEDNNYELKDLFEMSEREENEKLTGFASSGYILWLM